MTWLKSSSDILVFFCRRFSRLVLRQNLRRSPSWCQKGAFDLPVNSHYHNDNNSMHTSDEKKADHQSNWWSSSWCVTIFSSLTLKETFESLLGEFEFGPWNRQSKSVNLQQSPESLSRAPNRGLKLKIQILHSYLRTFIAIRLGRSPIV